MTLTHSGWGFHLFDYVNEGWKDPLIAQGHNLDIIELNYPNPHYREPMLLAHNVGGQFEDASRGSGEVFTRSWAAPAGWLQGIWTTMDG